jgi:two-component system sensor histidine kinase QseC
VPGTFDRFLGARWWSLRFRLTAAMLLVLIATALASLAVDRIALPLSIPASEEPLQDGLVLGVFSLAALTLIWVVIAWSLRPLSRACDQAAHVDPRTPGVRLGLERLPSEVAPLVEAVNGALDRMEAAFEAERRFTADAAHALRTPLSVLALRLQRGQLDGQCDWGEIDGDLRQLTALVNQLLDLARKEQAAREEPSATLNLARVAREAAGTILPLVEAAGRSLIVDLPDQMAVLGRRDDLRDMLVNVLENALLHGKGLISLRGEQTQTACVVDISDEGDGVPEVAWNDVFSRFRKLDPNSPGTGLGLSIVREVAEGHGGSARYIATAGCTLRIEIPVARD